MLVPLKIIIRQSASEAPQERTVALSPEAIARVEDDLEPGIIRVYCDGSQSPYRVKGDVEGFVEAINALCVMEGEPCDPADSATS
jgi:hypothetical protein